MTALAAWLAFPLLLAGLGVGWGVVVEALSGRALPRSLLIPVGLAATLVVAGTLTTFAGAARFASPLCAVGAGVGWLLLLRRRRFAVLPPLAALLAAVAAFLVYGAPVLLSGHPTFTGYLKLDDTATWFNVIDVVLSHSHSLRALNEAFRPPSTFTQVFTGDVGEHYPLGAFMIPGVGNRLSGINIAWTIQPYFALCAFSLCLSLYALLTPLLRDRRLRGLVAFLAAQPALLYGYSLWGGIKEMTAAFLLAAGVALAARELLDPPRASGRPRALLPLALLAGALLQTLEIGGGGWAAPVLLLLLVGWWLVGRSRAGTAARLRGRAVAVTVGGLLLFAAAAMIPVWASLASFLTEHFSGLFSEGQTVAEKFGNLLHPISGWQLVGVWPVGDFRLTAGALETVPFLVVALLLALVGLLVAARRRLFGPALYAAAGLFACGLEWAVGTTPWVLGKSLALSSPAILTLCLVGAALLWQGAPFPALGGAAQTAPPPTRRRRAGTALLLRAFGLAGLVVVGGGVLWSNVLAYGAATLAPRNRMVELEKMEGLVQGKGPTFINQYEVYADRHFLRAGAPVEPAEYRPVTLPLRDGAILTKAAWAELDAFSPALLERYRSLVTPVAPNESRPPSTYHLTYAGRYYDLWQRPAHPAEAVVELVPYGEADNDPYCGNAQNFPTRPYCSVNPSSVPPCSELVGLGRRAAAEGATLVAYQHPDPRVALGDQTLWPASWFHEPRAHALIPLAPGSAEAHIELPTSERYTLYLGGSFSRGFKVAVDGRPVGVVKNELFGFLGYVPVATLYLAKGIHRVTLTYPEPGLAPGSAEGSLTALTDISFEPLESPPSGLLRVPPQKASTLCGRPLEWVELVKPAAP